MAQPKTKDFGRKYVYQGPRPVKFEDLPERLQPKTEARRKNVIARSDRIAQAPRLDKDPDLDDVCGFIIESGLSLEQIEQLTIDLGRKVSRYTLAAWLYGNTVRPHNYTFTSVMLALGYAKSWTKV